MSGLVQMVELEHTLSFSCNTTYASFFRLDYSVLSFDDSQQIL